MTQNGTTERSLSGAPKNIENKPSIHHVDDGLAIVGGIRWKLCTSLRQKRRKFSVIPIHLGTLWPEVDYFSVVNLLPKFHFN